MRKLFLLIFVEGLLFAAGIGIDRMFPDWNPISWFIIAGVMAVAVIITWQWPNRWLPKMVRNAPDPDWTKFNVLPLNYAACLWAGLQPSDSSLKDPKTQSNLAELRLAVRHRKLQHPYGDLFHIFQLLQGSSFNADNMQFSKEELNKYARKTDRKIL